MIQGEGSTRASPTKSSGSDALFALQRVACRAFIRRSCGDSAIVGARLWIRVIAALEMSDNFAVRRRHAAVKATALPS
jgi:hypothetical protein